MTVNDFSYAKVNSVNPLYLIIDRIDGYIEKRNGNKYLILVATDESKDTLKKYEELWNKIRDLTRPKTKNLDNCDEKYMKTKFNLNDDLSLKNVRTL